MGSTCIVLHTFFVRKWFIRKRWSTAQKVEKVQHRSVHVLRPKRVCKLIQHSSVHVLRPKGVCKLIKI